MLLSIKNLSKSFRNSGKETLQNINLDIEEGEFICLVGPSGCGKTTLLNIIAGLEEPTSGHVLMADEVVTKPGADRVVMFQEPALFPWLNVLDNVKFGMRLKGIDKKEQNERAEEYLKMVHLWDFRSYLVHELSGGMKQRTALARALALDSRVLLMDEPFSSLDKQTTNMLRAELLDIWERTGKTLIFVTHSVEEAVYFATRLVVLSDNPGNIKEIHNIDLPRPRQIETKEFLKVRSKILNSVRSEAKKNAKYEYDKD